MRQNTPTCVCVFFSNVSFPASMFVILICRISIGNNHFVAFYVSYNRDPFLLHVMYHIIRRDDPWPDLYAIVLTLALHLEFIQYNLNSNSFIKSSWTWNITNFFKYPTFFVVIDYIIASWNRNSFSLVFFCRIWGVEYIIFSTLYHTHVQWLSVFFYLIAKLSLSNADAFSIVETILK